MGIVDCQQNTNVRFTSDYVDSDDPTQENEVYSTQKIRQGMEKCPVNEVPAV